MYWRQTADCRQRSKPKYNNNALPNYFALRYTRDKHFEIQAHTYSINIYYHKIFEIFSKYLLWYTMRYSYTICNGTAQCFPLAFRPVYNILYYNSCNCTTV